jgi:hypothetical protein
MKIALNQWTISCAVTLAVTAPAALAQQAAPPPPKAAVGQALLVPPSAKPPAVVAPASVPASQRTPTPAAVAPMPRASRLPVDSVRPATIAAPAVRPMLRKPPPTPGEITSARASVAVRTGPVGPPAGATMQCKDGTFLAGRPLADRCSGNGGVAVTFPSAPPPPPAAKRP